MVARMSGAQKPRVLLRTSARFGHLRLRLSLQDTGLMSWALLPLDETGPNADMPLVSGFLDQGNIDDLTVNTLQAAALDLQVFLDTAQDLIEAGASDGAGVRA
jgi:hypothetical protein